MVSTISLCLLAIGLTAVSSQLLSAEEEFTDSPVSDRRTFKHGKPVKYLPLLKKHKKFGSLVPHVFGKTQYADLPVIQEAPKPIYKVHRYQGIELKPLPEVVTISTPAPFIETHSVDHPVEFGPILTSGHSLSTPLPPTNLLLYPVNDKPIFSTPTFSAPPSGPIFANLPPPPPPKPIFAFPPPPQPVVPSLPITAVPSIISIPRLVPGPIFSQISALPPPTFTSLSASISSNPPQPILPPVKIQSPVLPSLPPPTPTPAFSYVSVKVPAPALPPVPVTPAPPIFSTVSVTPAPIAHAFPTISPPSLPPVPAPTPLPISSFPIPSSPAPALSKIPFLSTPVPTLSSASVSPPPEPEYPYPPSGFPIPSFIKDISLGDIEIKDSSSPTIETPKYQEVTPTNFDYSPQNLNHGSTVKTENGFLQKLKGWKADKANAALSHLSQFKQKPFSVSLPQVPNKIPQDIPATVTPVYPTLQVGPINPLPLAQAPLFFPPSSQFFPPTKYENFPPNNVDVPPIFNSYGVPIPRDSYSAHASHDRLSSAASEEEPSVVPAPKKEQTVAPSSDSQQLPSAQFPFQFESQLQAQSTSNAQPIYVPEENKSANEEDKTLGDTQQEADNYSAPQQQSSENLSSDGHSYLNHKE